MFDEEYLHTLIYSATSRRRNSRISSPDPVVAPWWFSCTAVSRTELPDLSYGESEAGRQRCRGMVLHQVLRVHQ